MGEEANPRKLKKRELDLKANGQEGDEIAGQDPQATSGPDERKKVPAMGPPPKLDFKATPTSAQPPSTTGADTEDKSESHRKQSDGQPPATPAKQTLEPAKRETTHKRSHEEIDQSQPADDDGDLADSFNDPSNTIATFDWMDLESRYHQQMEQYAAEEQDIYRSFEELCGVSRSLWS